MEIIYYNSNLQFENLGVTIGAYDGIHNGHIKIFKTLSVLDIPKAVISFDIHPDYVLNKRKDFGNVLTNEEKANILSLYNIDYLIILNKDILNLSYDEFNKVLIKLGVSTIVVGEDFRYGKNALGSVETLKDFNLIKVGLLMDNNVKLSSNTIREYLTQGKVDELEKYGFNLFEVSGVVTKGAGLGHKLGFPTANLSLKDKYSNIRKGVYAVEVYINDTNINNTYKYIGVCNVGVNPTVNTQDKIRLEVFLINENIDLYNKVIRVVFKKFIRDEKKFDSVEELVKQINSDVYYTINYLGDKV